MAQRWSGQKPHRQVGQNCKLGRLQGAVVHLALAVCLLLGPATKPLLAQGDIVETGRGWSVQAKIPGHFQNTLPPRMVADRNRTVHAFTTMPLSDDPNDSASLEHVIYYSQWSAEEGWSKLNDIILTPIKRQARVQSVFLDNAGVIHLVFFGGDELEANIYYSWAPAALAGQAGAWSSPEPIGFSAITPDVAGLAGDGQGRLVMIYSGNLGEGNSLYAVYSTDGGATWSDSELLFSTYKLVEKVFDFQMSMGPSGAVHVVWNVTDQRGQNVSAYYAKLANLDERRWSEPMALDTPRGLGLAIPAVVEHQGQIIILYNNGIEGQVAPVQWMRTSEDGGVNWSQPIRPFANHIGRNGTISFVVDGADVLHVFFGQRTPVGGESPPIHGMWWSTWNSGWGPLLPVAAAPQSESFDPYDARAIVSQGNVILLTWRTDPGRKDVWPYYAMTTLDVAELPLEGLPAPVQVESLPGLSTEAADDSGSGVNGNAAMDADALVEMYGEAGQAGALNTAGAAVEVAGPAAPLVTALVPTLLFIVAALAIGTLRRRQKQQ